MEFVNFVICVTSKILTGKIVDTFSCALESLHNNLSFFTEYPKGNQEITGVSVYLPTLIAIVAASLPFSLC